MQLSKFDLIHTMCAAQMLRLRLPPYRLCGVQMTTQLYIPRRNHVRGLACLVGTLEVTALPRRGGKDAGYRGHTSQRLPQVPHQFHAVRKP